jgi:hypothetical protein
MASLLRRDCITGGKGMTDERRQPDTHEPKPKTGSQSERPTEQDGYVAARDEQATAERTEAEDRAAD